MYWDDAVIFGLVTMGMMFVFMGGLATFIIKDQKRKGKH